MAKSKKGIFDCRPAEQPEEVVSGEECSTAITNISHL